MADNISIEILCFNPEINQDPVWSTYVIPYEEKNTVLGALFYIRENIDPTLSFRYGCRYKNCGLCAMQMNGKPGMACRTYVKDKMRIAPLSGLPVIKDLVIERGSFLPLFSKHEIYIENSSSVDEPARESETWAKLRRCTDCLGCLSTCPKYKHGDDSFAGPYIFVKIAQLSHDPRDQKDRKAQAKMMGIDQCIVCDQKCYCLNGLSISDAINSLLVI